jgi:DeoR/GlpR family transcriptional regulator of sugar metabolism
MKAAERQLRIRELADSGDFLDVGELCHRFGASISTIRRDLLQLSGQGVLKRVHGGAISTQDRDDRGGPIERNHSGNVAGAPEGTRAYAEKIRIGRAAAALVQDGQTVILDGGSTAAAVARSLLGRRVQIITSSILIADIFWDSRAAELTLTGGYLYPRLGVLLGPFCEAMLSSISADLLIMGIGGITESGFSNSNTLIVSSERKMIEASREVIVVADHGKFGRRAMVDLAPLDIADVVVTDDELDPHYRDLLERSGVRVVLA